jgi:hypothetical protein
MSSTESERRGEEKKQAKRNRSAQVSRIGQHVDNICDAVIKYTNPLFKST